MRFDPLARTSNSYRGLFPSSVTIDIRRTRLITFLDVAKIRRSWPWLLGALRFFRQFWNSSFGICYKNTAMLQEKPLPQVAYTHDRIYYCPAINCIVQIKVVFLFILCSCNRQRRQSLGNNYWDCRHRNNRRGIR